MAIFTVCIVPVLCGGGVSAFAIEKALPGEEGEEETGFLLSWSMDEY